MINKIDLPSAEPERVAEELERIVGFRMDEMRLRLGQGRHRHDEILEASSSGFRRRRAIAKRRCGR